jgi:PAS domain S-box-containing protein
MKQSFRKTFELHAPHPGLEGLDDGFCMVDPAWTVTYWNAAAERLIGRPRQHVLGTSLWDAVPAWRRGEGCARLQAVAETGAPVRYLEQLAGRRVLSVHASGVAGGGLVIHFRDATEEVRRSAQYTALLESIRDGFLAVDESWTVVYLNQPAESLLHFPRERVVGASLWSLYPQRSNAITDCLRATMNDGHPRALREVRPDGRALRGRIFDVWTYPLSGGGLSVMFEDVAERVEREKELSRLASEARAANEAKSRFFAAVSHELRTPLNAIVGYTHLLESGTYGEMPPAARRAAERASACAEHLSRLVDDVLLLTTNEMDRLPLAIEELDLAACLPAQLRSLAQMAEAKGLEFALSCEEGLPYVESDLQRLRQLLVALASNAVKYTAKGSVSIRVRRSQPGETLPEACGAYTLFPDPHLEILVVDTGPGVPDADRERIFGAFEQVGDAARADSMARGTGLGLAIARQLARALRGSLDLASTSASGSTFRLRLPVRFPAAPPP